MKRSKITGIRGICENLTAPLLPERLEKVLAHCKEKKQLRVFHTEKSNGQLLSFTSSRGVFNLSTEESAWRIRGTLYVSASTPRELESDPLWQLFCQSVSMLQSTGTLRIYSADKSEISEFQNGRVVSRENEMGINIPEWEGAIDQFLIKVRIDYLLEKLFQAMTEEDILGQKRLKHELAGLSSQLDYRYGGSHEG